MKAASAPTAPLGKTVGDQLLVQGRLANGVVASIHYRGGVAKAGGLHWEINGTEGDLLVTSPMLGHLQLAPPTLRGGRGQEQMTLADLELPDAYVLPAIPQGFGWNVGHLYAALAPSLRESCGRAAGLGAELPRRGQTASSGSRPSSAPRSRVSASR